MEPESKPGSFADLASGRRAELLLSSVRDYALFTLDRDGRVASWNVGAQLVQGYEAEEVIGLHLSRFYPPEDVAAGRPEEDLELAERAGHSEQEGWRLRKDGSRFWANVVLSPMRDSAGNLIGFANVTRDLTERRAADQALRDSEERMRLLVSSVRDYAIFMLDPEGHVVTWNPGAERIKGYRPHQIIGKHISNFYTPEDRAAGLPQKLLGIATTEGRVENIGWRVRSDGTRFWADVVISAVRDDQGKLRGYAKVTRDLSERKWAEEQVRESEQRLRLLLESVKDYAIYMLDREGRIVTWNPGAERLKGYAAEEIVGRNFALFYLPEDIEAGKCEEELRIAAREGRYEDEGWRVRKDGSRFWASVVLSAVRDSSGELVGFAKVTRDLTDRRKAEEERLRLAQMQEALRVRDEFLSIAAHELRTPLTALQISLQSLAHRKWGLEEKVLQRLGRATRSAERLSELVETLLDVARISTGKLALKRDRLDLNEMLRDVVDRLRDSAASARCPLSVDLEGRIEGTWDRLRIEQVVINLLGNAFKYASGTPVRLRSRMEEGLGVIEIEDRGPGIPEADLNRIFGRFERASSIHHYGGLGLGLYVTQELVQAHGGTVQAQNLPKGGIRFTVRLPTEPVEGQVDAAPLN